MKKFFVIIFLLLFASAFPAFAQNDGRTDQLEFNEKTLGQNLKILLLENEAWLFMIDDVIICPEWEIIERGAPDDPAKRKQGKIFPVKSYNVKGRNISLIIIGSGKHDVELKGSTFQQISAFTCYLKFYVDQSKCERTAGDMKAIVAALGAYYCDNGQYPESGITNLFAELKDYLSSDWKTIDDGWDFPFIYETESINGTPNQYYKLISCGADGKPGPELPAGRILPNDQNYFNYDIVFTTNSRTCKCHSDK